MKNKKIAVRMRNNSLAFLQRIKEMKIREKSPCENKREKVKIVNDRCNVYKTKDEKSRIIYNSRYNDELEITGKINYLKGVFILKYHLFEI